MVLSLLGAGFLAVLIAVAATVVLLARNQDQSAWVRHTFEVERHVSAIQLSLARMRESRSVGDRAALQVAQKQLHDEIGEARDLTRDNPEQQRNVALLLDHSRQLEGLRYYTLPKDSVALRQLETLRTELRATAVRMLGIERGLLARRTQEQKANIQALYVVFGLSALLLAAVAVGSLTVIRRYTASLTEARDELHKLNTGLEDAVRVRTVDLQRANEEIQRFAYIVSHDLRSPLVNVMGFTAEVEASIRPLREMLARVDAEAPQLANESARLAITEDLPESIGFIRTSTQKMDRLINAILRLSREGRRTIVPESLSLTDLTRGVVDTLRHRIDELGVEVTVAPGMPTVVSDRLAVEQIVANLVENAVKYLRPGVPGLIQINGQNSLGRAIVHIQDNGRGIEKRDHERIFDLFRRSGEQDQPGEGIGLAHVRALAYRLGGTISVESGLGQGSIFTLNLPIHFSGDKGAAQ